ncbi:MAG: hypothetical protein WBK55_07820 [Alphaproteobacteria bacterium]
MRVMFSLPSQLVAEFKAGAGNELPKLKAFHEKHGHAEVALAMQVAANATNNL